MKKSVSIVSFAAIASAMFGIAAASPASASICKRHGHKVVGLPNVHRIQAMRSAIKRWSGTVRSHDGRLFANWRFARNRGAKLYRVALASHSPRTRLCRAEQPDLALAVVKMNQWPANSVNRP